VKEVRANAKTHVDRLVMDLCGQTENKVAPFELNGVTVLCLGATLVAGKQNTSTEGIYYVGTPTEEEVKVMAESFSGLKWVVLPESCKTQAAALEQKGFSVLLKSWVTIA
jgi:hypothetical protein